MKISTKAKILTSVLGAVALFGLSVCGNGTTDPTCDCPEKVHGNEPCGCGLPNCMCVQKEWSLAHNLTLVNETGEMFRAGFLADIDTTFVQLNIDDPSLLPAVATRNVRIIIIPGIYQHDNSAFDGSTIRIGEQSLTDLVGVYINLDVLFRDMLSKPDPNAVSMRFMNGETTGAQR
jgi:hypothetical protein